ncbi:OLC1v1026558C1 [Oldenlandia corymbosa var. corymbosa]|uniref:OLC1v1026558C1 n=1 Tax=Oldenlandia corymbosa var. corymbosa TaxID=529605 RepID=A0AAV1C831_OLDCO|nr:OLC1v1026558C1 [Oldenlandia corymbosa var. corymbosa]
MSPKNCRMSAVILCLFILLGLCYGEGVELEVSNDCKNAKAIVKPCITEIIKEVLTFRSVSIPATCCHAILGIAASCYSKTLPSWFIPFVQEHCY